MKKTIIFFRMILVFWVILFVSMFGKSVSAEPSINYVTGTVADGGSVSISGSGFGATEPAIHKWDDFEGATHVISQDVGAGPGTIPWTFQSGNHGQIDNTLCRIGSTKHARSEFVHWRDGFAFEYGDTLSPLYVTFWWRWEVDGTTISTNWKPYWPAVYDKITPSAPRCSVCFMGESGPYTISPGDDGASTGKWGPRSDKSEWLRVEFFGIESGAAIADGTVIWRIQNSDDATFTTVFELENEVETRHLEEKHWTGCNFGDYARTDGDLHIIDTDDVYIANSRARVEIGDNPNWGLCTHREIQIPTAWSSNSISFTVNQGSFQNGEAYLFVVDANGDASTGYPISFGGTPTYECNDGLDNDGDGATDLADNGCSSSTDNDETNCGDGVCEGGENCESCPSDCGCVSPKICCNENCITPPSCPNCDDGDSCTTDSCTGYGTCNPSCQNIEITSCINDDGCCPSACSYSNDNDCSVECLVDSDCVDVDCKTKACTDNQCVYQDVGCQDNDGCCPSMCTQENDNDCIIDYCSNLALLMHFDESSSTVQDFSGNENNGTVSGATFTSLGKFNGAFEFDGVDDHITINDDSSLDITDELTLEAWVYPTTITDWDYIISKAPDSSGSPYLYYGMGFYSNTDQLRIRIFTDSSYQALSQVITPNQWYHVVGTYSNSNNELNIYINGVLVNSTTATGQIATNDQDVLIGGYEYEPTESWNGYIDEVAVWSRALSSDEILNLYNSGAVICEESLCGEADTDNDGVVDLDELYSFIERWKNNEVIIGELMKTIGEWKDGC